MNQSTTQSTQAVASNIIELALPHKKNFETYITDYATTNELAMTGEVWKKALEAAQRLDYTGDRSNNPDMQLSFASPRGLLGRLVRFFRRAEPPVYLTELDDIRAFLMQAPEAAAQQSEIKWGVLRNGFATRMEATLRPGGQQKGSRPTPARLREAPGWELLAKRKQENGHALFVRGHLLYDGWGGIGVNINLAALTAAARGDFGANHANWVHRYLVEGPLLWAYVKMHNPNRTITQVYYRVIADYNRPPRRGTAELKEIARAYEEAVDIVQAKSVTEGGSGGAEPTHQQVMKELALNPPSPHLFDAMLAVSAKSGEKWSKVHERVAANQQLWQFEDENVPLAFRIRYSWIENGVLVGPVEETVSIVLPSSLAAKFEQ